MCLTKLMKGSRNNINKDFFYPKSLNVTSIYLIHAGFRVIVIFSAKLYLYIFHALSSWINNVDIYYSWSWPIHFILLEIIDNKKYQNYIYFCVHEFWQTLFK